MLNGTSLAFGMRGWVLVCVFVLGVCVGGGVCVDIDAMTADVSMVARSKGC